MWGKLTSRVHSKTVMEPSQGSGGTRTQITAPGGGLDLGSGKIHGSNVE